MLADRFKKTAIALVAFALTIIIRRGVDSFFVPPDILNIINIATVFMLCLVIVVITRTWIPRFKR